MLYVITLCLIISCSLYMYLYNRIIKRKIFYLKLSTSLFFLLLAIYNFCTKKNTTNNYDMFILLGIISGFFGDVLLGFRNLFSSKKHLLFVLGISMFLLGHLLYIRSMFFYFDTSLIYPIILSIILLILSIIITRKTNVDFGKSIIVDYMYMLVTAFFISISLFNLITHFNFEFIITFIGICSFATSDFILSYLYFSKMDDKKRRVFKLINIATYYIGQLVLALSIIFL